jgi:FkbM family methyltransferase
LSRIRSIIENVLANLPTRRKAQVLDIALSHLTEVCYSRLSRYGFQPKGIIDIGAYHGEWSKMVARIFPLVPLLMIEAQPEKRAHLESACAQIPQSYFEMSLLGPAEGIETVFNVMERGSSLYNERSNAPRQQITLKMSTLDGIFKKYSQLNNPLLLKLDVQGAELDVLTGGARALTSAEVIQLEVALMEYNEGAPDIAAVLKFMTERNFTFFDVCGFVKPDARHLSQIDVLFVCNDSQLRTNFFVFD